MAANNVFLLVDALIYYGVSNTKKQLSIESSNTTWPEETGTRSMLQVTMAQFNIFSQKLKCLLEEVHLGVFGLVIL